MNEFDFSCMNCKSLACDDGPFDEARTYPSFCPTKELEPALKQEVIARYGEEENAVLMKAAAEVEAEGYCRWPRAEEIIRFAQKIGAKKIGIATCVGLIREAEIFGRILKARGFSCYSIGCKVGAIEKTTVGISEACSQVGEVMCNPILQAKLLEAEETDLNVVIGLCVGHDSLFYKSSAAPVTTLIAKDRVTGHNPAAVLYTANSYYKNLLKG